MRPPSPGRGRIEPPKTRHARREVRLLGPLAAKLRAHLAVRPDQDSTAILFPNGSGRCASCAAATRFAWSTTCSGSKAGPPPERSASSAPTRLWPAEGAITDEVCDLNPFKGVRARANDPRAMGTAV
ncbi:MAG: hypothetical protein ACM3JL_00275 [Nitrososphaerota archaeon]